MTNSQLIANIRAECKKRNIVIADMLNECGLSKGFVYDVEKRNRTPSIDKISAIADFLSVSIDYLLGRTENPQSTINQSVGNYSNGNQLTVNNKTKTSENIKSDDITNEFMEIFKNLPFSDKLDIMNMAMKKKEVS